MYVVSITVAAYAEPMQVEVRCANSCGRESCSRSCPPRGAGDERARLSRRTASRLGSPSNRLHTHARPLMPLIILTGASGSGKTAIAEAIERTRPGFADVFPFDRIGVPSREAIVTGWGSDEAWQRAMTIDWLARIATLTHRNQPRIGDSNNDEVGRISSPRGAGRWI
jgi:hypothetical protein